MVALNPLLLNPQPSQSLQLMGISHDWFEEFKLAQTEPEHAAAEN